MPQRVNSLTLQLFPPDLELLNTIEDLAALENHYLPFKEKLSTSSLRLTYNTQYDIDNRNLIDFTEQIPLTYYLKEIQIKSCRQPIGNYLLIITSEFIDK